MTTSVKIRDKKEKIEKCKDRILKEQEKIKQLNSEIEELESIEVKGLLKELDMPLDEIKQFIKELSGRKSIETNRSA